MEQNIQKWIVTQRKILEKFYENQMLLEDLVDQKLKKYVEVDGEVSTFCFEKLEENQVDVGILYSAKDEELPIEFINKINEREELGCLNVVFFTIDDIDIEQDQIYGTLYKEKEVFQGVTNIPPLIYNLVLHGKPTSISKMRKLRTKPNVLVINPINSFKQEVILEMLRSFLVTKPYILPIRSFNLQELEKSVTENEKVYLIPRRDFKRPEVIIVEKMSKEKVAVSFGVHKQEISISKAYYTISKMIKKSHYNIYHSIQTFKQNNLPVECRVYVQKNNEGVWQVTASIFKHELFAASSLYKHEVKNVEDENKEFHHLLSNIKNVSLETASFLDFFIPNVGTYTFDFIFDEDKEKFYFLYIGGCEQSDYLARSSSEHWSTYIQAILDFIQYQREVNSPTRLDEHEEDVD